MTMFLILLFALCIIGASYAKTEAEVKARFIGLGVQCSKDHPVTLEELQALSEHEFPDHKNAKCLMACVFKKADWMDSKGMFDAEKAMELSKIDNPEHADRHDIAKKLFDTCKQVNEEPISDGDPECNRAFLLAKCLTEHGHKLGFET